MIRFLGLCVLLLACAAQVSYLMPNRLRWAEEPTVGVLDTSDGFLVDSVKWSLGREAWNWGEYVEGCATADVCVKRGFLDSSPRVGLAVWPGARNRCDVFVLDPELEAYVVAHEIGHCFGLGHNETQPRSIMFPTMSRDKPHWVTHMDMDQLQEARRGR